jgi:hypothetical protein
MTAAMAAIILHRPAVGELFEQRRRHRRLGCRVRHDVGSGGTARSWPRSRFRRQIDHRAFGSDGEAIRRGALDAPLGGSSPPFDPQHLMARSKSPPASSRALLASIMPAPAAAEPLDVRR